MYKANSETMAHEGRGKSQNEAIQHCLELNLSNGESAHEISRIGSGEGEIRVTVRIDRGEHNRTAVIYVKEANRIKHG